MASKNKKMTRKTIEVQSAEPNSVLRLKHQVDKVKNDLKKADHDKALVLAKDKLLDSPNTKKTFKKTVAKRVDFGPDEKLYNSWNLAQTNEMKQMVYQFLIFTEKVLNYFKASKEIVSFH